MTDYRQYLEGRGFRLEVQENKRFLNLSVQKSGETVIHACVVRITALTPATQEVRRELALRGLLQSIQKQKGVS